MNAAILFFATFIVVLALGIQSLNVNGGHRFLAAMTSFAIGTSNLVILKIIPGPTGVVEIAAYLCGGPIGIVTAMNLHPYLAKKFGKREASTSDASKGEMKESFSRKESEAIQN